MNSDRNEQIVYLLLNYKTILVSQLSNKFSTSEKTILRAVQSINVYFKKYDLFVKSFEGKLTLIGDTSAMWKSLSDDKDKFTKHERLIYIFNHFMKTDEKITILDLADDLEVPTTQVQNDFKDLNNVLLKYEAIISNDLKKGLTINLLAPHHKHAIFIDLIFLNFLSNQTTSFIKNQFVKNFFNSYIYKILKNNYQIDNFNTIYSNLINLITKENIEWNEIDTILLAMLITIWINDECNKKILNLFLENSNPDIKIIIQNIVTKNDTSQLIERFNKKTIKPEKNEVIERCINEIKILVKNLLNSGLNFDEDILQNIRSHLENSLVENNLKYDLSIKNYISKIKNYINNYQYLWIHLRRTINKYFLVENDQDQITYGIFIYLTVWLDTQLYNLPMKILTVCIGGMGQSKMLATYLKTIYKRAYIEAMPFAFINNKIIDQFDLVISSIEITNTNAQNTLHLPVIFSVENKAIIHEKLNEIFYKQKMEKRNTEMQNILKIENIETNLPSESKTDAITRAGKKLVDLGYAKPEYISSMLRREAKVTTYIGNKIAIPHGEDGSQEMIINSGIVILHYKDPVKFDEPVNFIVGIASSNNLHLEILANIAEKFSEIEKVNELLINTTPQLLFNEFKIGD
ncbi:PTS system mannitol-specific IIA component [Spiroplasma sabaudiense Ar-1343]|uniref:PTS system mannitol-specific IIA component n=1 Tax=Spiroplasma sabaudiense Ar-1343 TaxID=1276257 RepID=W6ABQ2_9MOLU|nr:PTS sugar transporter subunit IIA [Spiroplasma sabaudiense]AHI54260.1 PTS system mannitol-specific IIA component [Spiroplasma sabaudiense Ar-1343]